MLQINDNYISELKKLQSLQLMIVKVVDCLCRKHNINYIMTGGTLLGAIRHQGFIPWDDDLDIAIPRKDYEQFLEICKKELPKNFFLQTPETDPHYGFAYAKVQLKGTSFLEENAKNSGAASGVFIDVFPLDYLPNEKRAQKKLWIQLKAYKVLLLCKNKYKYAGKKSVVKRIAFWGMRVYSLFFSREKIVKKLNEVVKKFNLIETDTYVNLFGAYELGREIFPRADVDLSKDILFENVFLRGPSNEKEFLSNLYGDYMQLPPEDKRYNRHNAVRLSFGEYAEIDI